MEDIEKENVDYLQPVEIAEGVYWVGFADHKAELYCNPYLIVDGEEAVLIDGGSRDDFSTVMLKILRVGIEPKQIKKLIYQHFDPDLCGNILQFESVINSEDLKVISHKDNNIFINYYSSKSPKLCIEELNFEYEFKSGRKLIFIRTPYSHASGSFITYDCKTKTLFTSDIFGSYDKNWNLFLELDPECENCNPEEICPLSNRICHLHGIVKFHKRIMTSSKALRYALERIEKLDVNLMAPQHGSLIDSKVNSSIVINVLKSLEDVGIDYFLRGSLDEK